MNFLPAERYLHMLAHSRGHRMRRTLRADSVRRLRWHVQLLRERVLLTRRVLPGRHQRSMRLGRGLLRVLQSWVLLRRHTQVHAHRCLS